MALFRCTKCGNGHSRIRARGYAQSYCLDCHAEFMRENRRPHSQLTPIQKFKANSRAKANVYKRRGLIDEKPCEMCRSPHAEMHHPDYSKALEVRWLCRPCHLDLHLSISEGSTVEHSEGR